MKSSQSELGRAIACALLWAAIVLPGVAQGQDGPIPWTFHHPDAELPGLNWSQLGKAYLGKQEWRDLGAKDAPKVGSRLVIADFNGALGKKVWRELGLSESEPASIAGQEISADTGLILLAPDPDGDGRLAFFTGADGAAVFQTMTVPADIVASGWFMVRDRKVVAQGPWPPTQPPKFDRMEPILLRLDLDFFALTADLTAHSPDEVALVLSRRFEGERAYFQAALGNPVDLFAFHRDLLHTKQSELAEAEALSKKLRHHAMVSEFEYRLSDLIGLREGHSPAIAFLVGDPKGTNARTFGPDPVTGRNRILLNVAAHTDLTALRISLSHELVHTRQTHFGPGLLDKAATEGIAAFLSGQMVPNQTDAQLLMWSADKLKAATDRQDAILKAFHATTQDRGADPTEWLTLHRPLQAVPGAPDRCAYWLGFLAARKWYAEHPDQGAKGLMELSATELFRDFQF